MARALRREPCHSCRLNDGGGYRSTNANFVTSRVLCVRARMHVCAHMCMRVRVGGGGLSV